MTRDAEYDAAYFTLLRAREEHEALLAYERYLDAERRRIDAFVEQLDEAGAEVPAKVRRPVDATAKPLLEALGRRRAALLEEQARVPRRLDAAQRFVQECESEVEALRR